MGSIPDGQRIDVLFHAAGVRSSRLSTFELFGIFGEA